MISTSITAITAFYSVARQASWPDFQQVDPSSHVLGHIGRQSVHVKADVDPELDEKRAMTGEAPAAAGADREGAQGAAAAPGALLLGRRRQVPRARGRPARRDGRAVVPLVDISPTEEAQKSDSGVVHHVAFMSRGFEAMKAHLQTSGVAFRTVQVPGGGIAAAWQMWWWGTATIPRAGQQVPAVP
jgi:hypothetical protein